MNNRIVIVAGRHRSLAQPGSAAMAHRCGRLFGEAVLAAAIAGAPDKTTITQIEQLKEKMCSKSIRV